MTRDIRIVGRVGRDLGRIYRWLEGRSSRGANSWYQAFWKAATKIVADPESFSAADEAARLNADIRETYFKTRKGRRYRIIFEFDVNEIRILCVRRPGQRPLQRRDLPDA